MNGRTTKTLVVGTGLFMLLGSPMWAAAEDFGKVSTFHALQQLTKPHAGLTPMTDGELDAVEGSNPLIIWSGATYAAYGYWSLLKDAWAFGEQLGDDINAMRDFNSPAHTNSDNPPGGARPAQDAGVYGENPLTNLDDAFYDVSTRIHQ